MSQPSKRKMTGPQDNKRQCICGKWFSSMAYGHHVIRCVIYQNQESTRRVYHSTTTSGPNNHIASAAVQQHDLSMKQQKQWIIKDKATVASSVMKQNFDMHKNAYNTQLKQMASSKHPNFESVDDTDNHDDNNSTDWSITFDAEVTNEVVDDGVDKDEPNDNNGNGFMLMSEKGHATFPAGLGNPVPPTFPIVTEFDSDKSIRFQSTVAHSTAAGIQLMDVIGQHSVDLSLYDDIVKFINDLAESGYDFNQKLPKRKALHKQCEKAFNYSSLRPKLIEVPVTTLSTPTITMPVFDIQAVLSKMLGNPMLMQEANFAANYDIFTGKPIHDLAFEDTAYYDEIHTGQQWPLAVDHYCSDSANEFPCGLVVFYDKSHADRNGSLAVSPVMFTLTLFNKAARAQCKFWDILAYIPNLDSGTNKTSDSSIGLDITAAQKCQDEHICLMNAFRQFKEINDNGGFKMKVLKKEVTIKVWVHIMVGDISGNNSLLGSYNNHNAQSPYRDCSCSKESFIDPDAKCTMIRKADVDQMKKDNDVTALRAASKHNIVNAFDTIQTGNPVDTIYHLTPPETMHAICSGIAPRMIQNIGRGFKKKTPAAVMQNLHLLLIRGHPWQSERGASSRPSSRNHIFETTKTQATELMGNLFLIMCALHTTMGKSVCIEADVTEAHRKGKIETIKMVLSFEKWINRRTLRSDIDDMTKIQSFIRHKLIPNLQKYFPRTDGVGWQFPKVHSLTKFPVYVQLFGSGINFYGGFGESHLKTFMKKLAHFTQRRASKFAPQLGANHYEQSLFAHSSFAIRMQTNMNYVLVDESAQQEFIGVHTITFTKRPTTSLVEYSINVKWPQVQSSKPLDDIIRYAISRYMATNDPSRERFNVTGYTSAKLRNNEDTLESYDSGPSHSWYKVDTKMNRFDWCMILTHAIGSDEDDELLDTWSYACPAQIHGFIRFDTRGVPTPCLLQKYNAKEIRQSEIVDETMYVIVRSHKNFLSWKEIEKKFVVPVQLGNLDTCTYILPVSRIVNPLYVFEDHGQQNGTPNPSFFATLPARYSSFYLDYKLNPQLIPGEGGLSQKCEEYAK